MTTRRGERPSPALPRRVVAATMSLVLPGACTPRDGERFHIHDHTAETVTIEHEIGDGSFATPTPGEGTSRGLTEDMCREVEPRESGPLVATGTGTGSGKTHTYGPLLCDGRTWVIGERPTR